jgi:hypothetical protein
MGSRSPLLSSIGLTLVFVGQLSALVHMAAVRHERCEEHGELVEAYGLPGAHARAGADRATDETAADAARSGPETQGQADEHDHCSLATTPCGHDAVVTLWTLAVPRALEHASPVRSAHMHPVSPLDVAPKTSPPAPAV